MFIANKYEWNAEKKEQNELNFCGYPQINKQLLIVLDIWVWISKNEINSWISSDVNSPKNCTV